jgi:hypothetical protein
MAYKGCWNVPTRNKGGVLIFGKSDIDVVFGNTHPSSFGMRLAGEIFFEGE